MGGFYPPPKESTPGSSRTFGYGLGAHFHSGGSCSTWGGSDSDSDAVSCLGGIPKGGICGFILFFWPRFKELRIQRTKANLKIPEYFVCVKTLYYEK